MWPYKFTISYGYFMVHAAHFLVNILTTDEILVEGCPGIWSRTDSHKDGALMLLVNLHLSTHVAQEILETLDP